MSNTYLLLDIAVISIPFIASFGSKYPFYKQWPFLAKAIFLTGLFFIIWDIAFTAAGIWGFNENYLVGLNIANLPLEEWLFFIAIPYACTFTFFAFQILIPKDLLKSGSRYITLFLFALCVALAVTHVGKHYTFFTCLFTAALLGLHLWKWNTNWLSWFYLSYGAIILPFILSNGVLTGLHFYEYPLINLQPENVTDQVVWYNNDHNLGIRLFSIPVDDLIYSLLLQLMAITYFQHFRKKAGVITS